MTSAAEALKAFGLPPRSPLRDTSFVSPKQIITEMSPIEPDRSLSNSIETRHISFGCNKSETAAGDVDATSEPDSDDSLQIELNIDEEDDICNEAGENDEEKSIPPEGQYLLQTKPNGHSKGPRNGDLMRTVRTTGRDTPEANNLLVQLICSQKDLKTPNWHDVVKAIYSNPGDVHKPHGWDAELPLHWAISERAPLFIIHSLLEIYPQGAAARGRYGALPLWYAIDTQGREEHEAIELVQTLLKLYPQGAQKKLDHILPIAKAHELGAPEAIIKALLDCDLPCTDGGVPVGYNAFSWAWILKETGDTYKTSIEQVLDAHPTIVMQLAKAVDSQNNVAVAYAHPTIREVIYRCSLFCGRYEIKTDVPPIHISQRAVIVHAVDYDAEGSYQRVFSEVSVRCDEVDHSVIDSVASLDVALRRLGGHMDMTTKVDLSTVFSNCYDSGHIRISCDEFMRYCKTVFGFPREIAIKFMKSERLFEKENFYRKSCNLDGRYVIPLISDTGATPHEIEQAITTSLSQHSYLRGYGYGCFIPCAPRDLLTMFHHDAMDRNTISVVMRDIAHSLQHLHSRGLCHGGLRMRNVLRAHDRYCLVDLTAAANLEIFYIQDADIIGDTLVTGYLPPEMFVSLTPSQELQVTNYWKSCSNFEAIRKRFVPAHYNHSCCCVRAFDTGGDTGTPRDLHALPYRPALASAQLDMWAYGLILFALSSGETLLPLSCGDDLTCARDIHTAARWTTSQLQERVDEAVSDPLAADLIMLLLQPDIRDRPSSMKQIIDHVYFSGVNNKRNSYIEQKIESIYIAQTRRKSSHITSHASTPTAVIHSDHRPSAAPSRKSPSMRRRTSNPSLSSSRDMVARFSPISPRDSPCSPGVNGTDIREDIPRGVSTSILSHIIKVDFILRRSLFESIDIKQPTCFVVVNQRLHYGDMVVKRDSISSEIASSVTGASDDVPRIPHSTEMLARIRHAQRWLGYLSQVCSAVSEGDAGVDIVDKAVRGIFGEEQLFLYLVDEITMLPVVPQDSDDVYPIQIKDIRSIIPRILPLLKLSLQGIACGNDLSVFGRCLGFPPSAIPSEVASFLQSEFHAEVDSGLALPSLLQQADLLRTDKTSIPGPGNDDSTARLVTLKVFGDSGEHASFSSHPLHCFAELIAKYDEENIYAGLRRIPVQDDMCVWTARNHIEKYIAMPASIDDHDEGVSMSSAANLRRDNDGTPQYHEHECDLIANTPVLLGRTHDGKYITAADLNNSILQCHQDILHVLEAVEILREADERVGERGRNAAAIAAPCIATDICRCIVS